MVNEVEIFVPDAVFTPTGFERGCVVAVVDGAFDLVGPPEVVMERYPAAAIRQRSGRVLIPGFVDTHHHLSESFAKSMVFGQLSQLWRRLWYPLECALTEEDAHAAAQLACVELLRGGFTTVVETACKNPNVFDAIEEAVRAMGVRCVLSQGYTDKMNFVLANGQQVNTVSTAEAVARLEAFILAHSASGVNLVTPSISTSSIQSCSTELLRTAAELCGQYDLVHQIHANEHLAEVEFSVETFGRRPIEYLDHIGALGRRTLIAHGVLVTPAEIRLLENNESAVSYCPVASIWKGNGVSPVLDYLARGIRVGLGTDATRSDGFRLMEAAETCQRLSSGLATGDTSVGQGHTWLRAATSGGAAAAGIGDKVGHISAGQRADFVLVDITQPELAPSWDLGWELVRLCDRSSITEVYVDGRVRVENGCVVGVDVDALVADVGKRAVSVVDRANA